MPEPRLQLLTRAGCHLCETAEALREHAAAQLARYKVPASVQFVPSLPHSLTGKVSRARLRELGLTRAEEEAPDD